MQEILLACIFLFVKHPYDVGDRIDVDDKSYTVVKMALMSTNFKRTDGKFVWIGHNILATKVIENGECACSMPYLQASWPQPVKM